MGSSSRPARRHAPAEQRRAQIIEAALGCFSARGYHATTMDHVAEASGLSKGSLYWHFDGKEDVFLALFDYLAAEIFGRFDAAAGAGDHDVVALLRRELELFFERFGDERVLLLAWAEFLTHPRGRERMGAIYRETRVRLAAMIRAGIERGELRELSPEGVAATLTGMIDSLILQAVIDPEFELKKHMETLWDLLYRGVAAPQTSRETA